MMNKKTGLIALLAGLTTGGAMAQFTYTTGDVLLCFRNGTLDMVVDIGSVTNLINGTHNQVIPITQFTGDQLAVIGTNGTTWSAFTFLSDNTLFITRPRTTPNGETLPWTRASSGSQGNVDSKMGIVPKGAADASSGPYNPASSSTAVIEPDASDPVYITGDSYHNEMAGAYGGQWSGTFQGNPENTTTNDVSDPTKAFTGAGKVQRSDFYQLSPTLGFGQPGTYLGYFEFNTNGAMSFVSYPNSIPSISGFMHTNGVTVVNYKTGYYGTYTLYATNVLNSTPVASTWTPMSVLNTGDLAAHQVQVNDTNNANFYTIQAQ